MYIVTASLCLKNKVTHMHTHQIMFHVNYACEQEMQCEMFS